MASCQGEQCSQHQLSFQVKGKHTRFAHMNNYSSPYASWYCNCQLLIRWSKAKNASFARHLQELLLNQKIWVKKKLKLLQNSNLVTGRDNQHWLLLRPSHMNCFKNSVATSRPRVFTDSFNSLISLSISWSSCKQNDVSADMCANIQCLHIST